MAAKKQRVRRGWGKKIYFKGKPSVTYFFQPGLISFFLPTPNNAINL
jgi:hypothetical protein